jgi:hypothetical protein
MKAETRETLEDIGFDTIKEYLQDLADEYGVEYETAYMLFEFMGENELFDGVVSGMGDAERYGL